MILYFSGTGNSRFAALSLANLLEDEAKDVTLCLKAQEPVTFSSEKPFVIVSPTYAWRLPRILDAFLHRVSLTGNRRVYFVMTCGNEIGDAACYLKKLCRTMHWDYCGVAPVRMAENYIALFKTPDTETAYRLTRAAGRRILPALADQIMAGEPLVPPKAGFAGWVMSHIINVFFYPMFVKAKKFRVVPEACIGCGLCEQRCPLGNITLTAGRPVWGSECTHCMACICGCPTHAVEYGRVSADRERVWNETPPVTRESITADRT